MGPRKRSRDEFAVREATETGHGITSETAPAAKKAKTSEDSRLNKAYGKVSVAADLAKKVQSNFAKVAVITGQVDPAFTMAREVAATLAKDLNKLCEVTNNAKQILAASKTGPAPVKTQQPAPAQEVKSDGPRFGRGSKS